MPPILTSADADFWCQAIRKEEKALKTPSLYSRENLELARLSKECHGVPLPSLRPQTSIGPVCSYYSSSRSGFVPNRFMATPQQLSRTALPQYMHLSQTTPYRLPGSSQNLFSRRDVWGSLNTRDVWWREPPRVFSKYMENSPRGAIKASEWSHVAA